MKFLSKTVALLSLAGHSVLFGTTVATPPAGVYKLRAEARADTLLSLPLHLRSEFSGRVAGVSADRVTIAATGLNNDRYAPSHAGTYYLQFVTGSLAGMTYRILSNTGNVFHLATTGDDLTNHPLGAVTTGAAGDVARVRRYWTINDVLGQAPSDWSSLAALPGLIYMEGDALLVPDNLSLGTNGGPELTVFYVTSSGWRAVDGSNLEAGTVALPPGQPFTVRRASATSLELAIVGYVQQSPFIVSLPSLAENAQMDVAVATVFPEAVSLALAGLTSETGVWSPLLSSISTTELNDVVLDYSLQRKGFGRSADRRFHLVGPNWFEADLPANDQMLEPGAGYILRFRGTHIRRYWLQLSSF